MKISELHDRSSLPNLNDAIIRKPNEVGKGALVLGDYEVSGSFNNVFDPLVIISSLSAQLLSSSSALLDQSYSLCVSSSRIVSWATLPFTRPEG